MSGIGHSSDDPTPLLDPAIGYEPWKPQPIVESPQTSTDDLARLFPPTPAYGAMPARPDPPRELTDEDLATYWPDRIVDPQPSFFVEQVDEFHWMNDTSNTLVMLNLLRRTGAMPEKLADFLFLAIKRPQQILQALLRLATETPSVRATLDNHLSKHLLTLEKARAVQRKLKEEADRRRGE
jgi:hypothetical protein